MENENYDKHIEKEENIEKNSLFWVIAFNNDHNTYEEVIQIIQKATCCSLEIAEHIACEIDQKGKSKVMIAPFIDAKEAADEIAQIGIQVVLEKEK